MKPFITLSFISLVLFFINGCIVLDKYEFTSTQIDLSEFENQGIFVTTGDLYKDYKSLSLLEANCYNGFAENNSHINKRGNRSKKDNFIDEIYSEQPNASENIKNYHYKLCTLNDLFNEMIIQAKERGANGIIKLEIRNISKTGTNKTTQKGVQIIGLAVKIKD